MSYTSTFEDIEYFVSILLAIEADFDIEILDDEASQIDTIQDLIDLVKQKVNGKEIT